MALYCYKAEDGTRIERSYPIGKAPQAVRVAGRTYSRDYRAEGAHRTPEFRPFKTYVVPKRYPGFKHDTDGRCIVESRSQMETYRKQQGLEWT